ncbi:MAG: RNA-binding S4 domain-containing protein [Candidatus Woesearchaeota archaeon]
MEPYERIDRRTIDDKVYETLKDVREDDAVLVRYKPSSFMESSIGFVNKIRKHDLFLCPDRDPKGVLFKLSNRILGQSVHYHEILRSGLSTGTSRTKRHKEAFQDGLSSGNMRKMEDNTHSDWIELNAFIKAQGLASTGGQAKNLIRSGKVYVDGVIETRNKRKLFPGSKVSVDGKVMEVR